MVVRRDLSPGLTAAMIVHAAGESGRLSPDLPQDTHAVALTADAAQLEALRGALDACGAGYRPIVEDGQLCALGLAPGPRQPARRLTSHLPLVGKEVPAVKP